MMKCDYTYEFRKVEGVNFLLITDLNLGRMSVTNGIENCIEEIREENPGNESAIVIYRDSEGIWDGYDYDRDNFFRLNTSTTAEEAINYYLKTYKK